MAGRFTQFAVKALDGAARRLGVRDEVAPHLATGRRGEEAAYFYLRRLGYTIVARNWRSPRRSGELDLVGWDGGVLCIIEVKTRIRGVPPEPAGAEAGACERGARATTAGEVGGVHAIATIAGEIAGIHDIRIPAEAAVNHAKQEEIGVVAREFLRRLPPRTAARADVVSVYLDAAGNPEEITLFKNAFPLR